MPAWQGQRTGIRGHGETGGAVGLKKSFCWIEGDVWTRAHQCLQTRCVRKICWIGSPRRMASRSSGSPRTLSRADAILLLSTWSILGSRSVRALRLWVWVGVARSCKTRLDCKTSDYKTRSEEVE